MEHGGVQFIFKVIVDELFRRYSTAMAPAVEPSEAHGLMGKEEAGDKGQSMASFPADARIAG
jgi:hypothetical protein